MINTGIVNNKIRFIDLFCGIGGIKMAFENSGYQSVLSTDNDFFCKKTFDHNFYEFFRYETEMYLKDISKVDIYKLPCFELLTAGFPCQPFSVAGYKKGFNDKKNGKHFFKIIEILKAKRPPFIFLENVKNIRFHDNGNTFKVLLKGLESIGYNIKSKVLNTKDYGNLPQNRERLYIVGFLDRKQYTKFSFPEKITLNRKISDCLEHNKVSSKYYYNDKPLFEKLQTGINKHNVIYQWRRKYIRENKSCLCPTLTANMGTGGNNVPIIWDKYGIRKLTPRECANFQGFPKSYCFPSIADSHLYKQIGNSVSITVVSRIAENIKKSILE